MSDLSTDLRSLKIERASPRVRRSPWGLLGAIGVLGYVGYAYGAPYVESRLATEVTTTSVVRAARGRVDVRLQASGYIEPRVVARVEPKLGGRVARVYVSEGDEVKQGDVLLELERADREAAIEAARMRERAAEARAEATRANLTETILQTERQRGLVDRGAAPRAAVEDLEARAASIAQNVEAARADAAAARAEIHALRVDLGYMNVTAPIDGRVTNRPPEVGELIGVWLGRSSGSIELVDFSRLELEADVPEAHLHAVELGAPCEITLDAFPARRYRGEVARVKSRANRAKATVAVSIRFVDVPEGVMPDMAGRVALLADRRDPLEADSELSSVVPASALATRNNGKVVFIVEDDVVRVHGVEVGEPTDGGLALLKGPAAGARLVAHPPDSLRDGQRVRVRP